MSTARHINRICAAAVILSLVLTVLFMNGSALGLVPAGRNPGYESRLFDTSAVHTVDIVMDDWDTFISTCENEEYSPCSVVIDGESFKNVGIRAKGNTSLSSVRAKGSQRYSFKLEFDQYETGKTFHGLDKLSLNNLIQDSTMMKDYLVYQMMGDFGADAPLCSYAYITVNGGDWGLYLAVEGVEDSFLERNYGSDSGDLYKPDSLSFGGGRGNGRDFDFENMDFPDMPQAGETVQPDGEVPEGQPPQFPGNGAFPDGFSGQAEKNLPESSGAGDSAAGSGPLEPSEGSGSEPADGFPERPGNFDSGGFGGMGSDDVKLQYIDDDPESYSNIFDNAKTDVTSADRQRLIEALKNLSSYTDLENTLDTGEVLRYFVVHNFVCNEDSYTGAMVHNYYLHEQDGQLSMIPWDYNLAFGTFQGGSASSSVNASIDSPVSGGSVDDRPMAGWIFSDGNWTSQYHELFEEFIDRWFSDGQLIQKIEHTAEMLRSYVESDPTKFCTAGEFETGVQTLEQFVTLRAEAVSRQLAGDSTPVDTAGLDTSAMGSMDGFGGPGGNGGAADPGFMPDRRMQPDTAGTGTEAELESSVTVSEQPVPESSGESPEESQTGAGQPARNGNAEGETAESPAGQPGMEFPGNAGGAAAGGQSSTASAWILLAASALLLLAGLAFAAIFKH